MVLLQGGGDVGRCEGDSGDVNALFRQVGYRTYLPTRSVPYVAVPYGRYLSYIFLLPRKVGTGRYGTVPSFSLIDVWSCLALHTSASVNFSTGFKSAHEVTTVPYLCVTVSRYIW